MHTHDIADASLWRINVTIERDRRPSASEKYQSRAVAAAARVT
jgi:hypothetical protein